MEWGRDLWKAASFKAKHPHRDDTLYWMHRWSTHHNLLWWKCCIYMVPNPSHNLCALYPPSVDQTGPLSDKKPPQKLEFLPYWSTRPPAAPIMRVGGTEHECRTLKSVSQQGTVCPCMKQIALIIVPTVWQWKIVSLIFLQLFFLFDKVWFSFSQCHLNGRTVYAACNSNLFQRRT